MFALFLSFFDRSNVDMRLSSEEFIRLQGIVNSIPKLTRALIYQAESSVGRIYENDDTPPQVALQLYFSSISDLERACSPETVLQALGDTHLFPSLVSADGQHQAMAVRQFDVPEPYDSLKSIPDFCTFLVHYPGQAENFDEWFDYYVANHPPVMRKFPAVREIEICSRVDWRSSLPWSRVNYMQRNKVAFDSPESLMNALNSPIKNEMSKDSAKFPPYTGGSVHHPLITTQITKKRY